MNGLGIDPQVAWDKLSNFQTADELRDYFVSEQIFGVRARARACPIATWMMEQTGKPTAVAKSIWVGMSQNVNNYLGEIEFEHTEATRDFIEAFDHEKYPELDINNKEG